MSDREKVINDQQREIEELEERLAIVLEGQPEIVRCKDCKYYSWHTDSCDHIGGIVSKDFFCADGERKK